MKRKRKTPKLPYYRVRQSLPLGDTPAVRALLQAEGLWELVVPGLREVYYHQVGENGRRRDFCAIGWPNENGGWEIRHPRYTGCLGPKGITTIAGKKGGALVFATMTDYLCWKFNNRHRQATIYIANYPELMPAAQKRAAKHHGIRDQPAAA